MPLSRLDQRTISRLTPREKAFDLRDSELRGFGIRVLPSGKKHFFVHAQHQGRRIWKTVGDAEAFSAPEARARAASVLASIKAGHEAGCVLAEDTVFERVADEVFRRYGRAWKPSTVKINRSYYENHILPWFQGRQIGDITAQDVQHWFGSLRTFPHVANRAAPVLSVILRQAERYGYRKENTNPCQGIRRYRHRARERFLSPEEIRRLDAVLTRHRAERPLHTALVRLLLLTGCRVSELRTLQWTHYREGKLFLPDSKTGPRTVWLSSPARGVLHFLPRTSSFVFPSPRGDRPMVAIYGFWHEVRTEAQLPDLRLRELRHTYASIALMHGESVLTIGRLLGHRESATTLKYIHLLDTAVRQAVEAVGAALEG